jgi:hypothetical protein
VIEQLPNRGGRTYWRCRCDCSVTRDVIGISLTIGNTQSCGCLNRDATAANLLTHGYAKVGHKTREYRIWVEMNARCRYTQHPKYRHYGGRGITVCQEWRADFPAFLAAITALGPRPPGWSLDRIDNERGYEPGNIRWASALMQRRNQRREHR